LQLIGEDPYEDYRWITRRVSVKSFPKKRETVVPSQEKRNELRRAKFFDATLTLIERGKLVVLTI
jgi:hypothetical protein